MSTADNGAIDYRRRVRERKAQQAATEVAPAVSLVTDATYDPPLEQGVLISTDSAIAVESTPPAASPVLVAPAVADRTPQAVREQAKSALTQLLSVSDADYNTMMTELSATDPILYAAVVDEINNARAVEPKTA